MCIWFEWLLSYSLATERKRNTGLLRMESYAAVLNISAFLGPELRRDSVVPATLPALEARLPVRVLF